LATATSGGATAAHENVRSQPVTSAPTGTVTFYFTDIEGSTRLWEQHPRAMSVALARHDAILQQMVAAHGGLIFKTVGDGIHAVFARASDALEAALAAQRALHAEPWGATGPLRVRMALHSGVAEQRAGDYFGPALNRVAGILDLGHGGQVLLARTTQDLVADALPFQISLRDLGEQQLNGLSRPEQIFQLVSPDLPNTFPPLQTSGALPAGPPTPALSLLTTKLYIPPARPNLVPRPRLTARLQAGLAGKLTLIAAPAGFGKTTLLTQGLGVGSWGLESASPNPQLPTPNSRSVAWVTLDSEDNDPIRFWSYVIAALDTLQVGMGSGALGQLQSPQPPPIETILTALLNTLSAWTMDVVLILDDYHLIDAPPIHQALAFLLDHLPPRLHLVLAARADPPLPLSRLRARGELTELRAADLRFTPEEAAAFLIEVMRLPLSAAAVAALETRTEGWIAGLQFAALAMRDRTDLDGFIAAFTGSNRFIVDYLAEEVLNHLPHHLQTFLLQTAILDRMCGPLCDAVLGIENAELKIEKSVAQTSHSQFSILNSQLTHGQAYSQVLLDELERANLFIVPLDETRQWYRYHHLFVDVLRSRLSKGAAAENVATLHRRASAWFEDHGFVIEAIHHALAGDDGEQAARLVALNSDTILMQGGMATLMRWLIALPDAAFTIHPKLALDHAFLLAAWDNFGLSERRLAAAEHGLHAALVPDRALLGQASMVRAVIALMSEYPAEVTLAAAQQALELLPASSTIWRIHANMLLGVGFYAQAGDIDRGLQSLVEAEQAGMRVADAFTVVNAFAHRSIVLEIAGQLRESEQLNQDNLQRAAEPFWQGVPLAGHARFGLSRVLYERNQLHAARDHLMEAITQLEVWSLKRPIIITYVLLARVYHALGEPDRAREWMDRVIASVQKDNLKQTFSHWAAFQARMHLAQGNLTAAVQWAREIEPTTSGELNPAHEVKHITLAQVYLAQQRLDDAERLLARLLAAAQAAGRMGRVLQIVMLQALVASAQGNKVEACATLERALMQAEPEGYIRSFVDHGARMRLLLADCRSQIIQRGPSSASHDRQRLLVYVDMLLSHFGFPILDFGLGEAIPIQNPKSEIQNLIEPLSDRELEVLRLIGAGRSNQEIADTLIIALSTVKRHINNIYGKLDAQSRTQAIARARDLHLL
jgi:LuxR family transcriptional regulator, maltose regulon positive regulatory protein